MSFSNIRNDIMHSFYSNPEKVQADAFYPAMRWFFRPLSFYITPLFLKLGMSANQVTYLGTLILFIGLFLLSSFELLTNYIGVFLVVVYQILDFVDGNIARYKKKKGTSGQFLDGFMDCLSFLIFIPIVYKIVFSKNNSIFLSKEILFILGIGCSVGALIYQIFRMRMLYYQSSLKEKSEIVTMIEHKGMFKKINRIFLNIPLMTPFFLLVSLYCQLIEVFFVFYFSIHVVMSFFYIILKFRKFQNDEDNLLKVVV